MTAKNALPHKRRQFISM